MSNEKFKLKIRKKSCYRNGDSAQTAETKYRVFSLAETPLNTGHQETYYLNLAMGLRPSNLVV